MLVKNVMKIDTYAVGTNAEHSRLDRRGVGQLGTISMRIDEKLVGTTVADRPAGPGTAQAWRASCCSWSARHRRERDDGTR
jgi:hypothetical protein